ncbi:MAG: outer membrane lipoprotein-sorting protein [Candidatus Omnitrophica bacterium]|nr:outer membrane lipoprotein-sorting protein [Candidatus Omnitrophota bacterium]
MEIAYHNKYSLFAKDFQQEGNVFYVDPSGFTRKRIWERLRIVEGDKGDISYKDLIAITYPTEVKGLAVLTWTYKDYQKDQEVWLWIPSLKKARKISASEDDDAFMGSDLTVEEVSTRRFEDETYELKGEDAFKGYTLEETGEMKAQGAPCFIIECRPKKSHWYYDKRVVWVDKSHGGIIFEEYYDKTGRKFKTVSREWDLIDVNGQRYPTQISLECKDLRTNHRTTILMSNTRYDQGIDEQNFTVKALMRSRW